MNFRCTHCGTVNSPAELECRHCGGALELGRETHSLTGTLAGKLIEDLNRAADQSQPATTEPVNEDGTPAEAE